MFIRSVSPEIVSSLQEQLLFKEKILPDINSNKIFCAIRNNRIDFYYKGGKLFSYTNTKEFLTHVKYAAVIHSDAPYVTQAELKDAKFKTNFVEGYDRIKENCSKYSEVEADGVSRLYHQFPYTTPTESDVVVLDIEISLKTSKKQEGDEADKTQNRIDILMYHKKEKKLCFYEAKHFSNKELWATAGKKPRVVDQIKRYEEELKIQKENILSQYAEYIKIVNDLFWGGILDIVKPEQLKLDDKVGLLVFGFDNDQKNGRMKQLLFDDGSLKEIKCYCIGNIGKIKAETMWD